MVTAVNTGKAAKPAAPPQTAKPQGVVANAKAMLTSAVSKITIPFGSKSEKSFRNGWSASVEVDIEKLPPNAVAYLLKLGIEKHIASALSGKVGETGAKHNKSEAEALAAAEKKIADLYAGKIGRTSSAKADPVEKKAQEIGAKQIQAFYAQQDPPLKITLKAAKEAVAKMMADTSEATQAYAAKWRAQAAKEIESAAKAVASIDLSALGLTLPSA